MSDDKKKTLEMLAEKLEVWPKDTNEELHPDGWRWVYGGVSGEVLLKIEGSLTPVIYESEWREEKAKGPVWEEGDETTEGTIAYVSTEHKNVMVRSTHGIREFDGRFLQRKKEQTRVELIRDRLVEHYGNVVLNSEILDKIIVDALVDWEPEQNV